MSKLIMDERHIEDRLRKRLARLGYQLKKSKTITPKSSLIQLKRLPVVKGFRISKMDTDEVVGGEQFDLTLKEVENWWMRQVLRVRPL